MGIAFTIQERCGPFNALLWEGTIMLAIRTILHPTDFSDYSCNAFRLACSLARDYGAKLIVLHVAQPPFAFAGEGVLIQPPEFDTEPLREQLLEMQPSDPSIKVQHRLIHGDPVPEVLSVAEETKCDLIVLGTHGRTGLGRLLMGSVAEQIVRHSTCPVLTVKTPLLHELDTEAPTVAAAGKEAVATA
jgi:universal stress protein A